ncbi:TPA: 3',5'-cyclic-AMP phosphodiesterase [Mannheimia haemolytica]|nr:3',5'-cyclic-AMP phosphodiesterase [Mannheimia haemolytica]AGQ39147.1 3',5'-cyclic-nucleotide phosphodiesterase [Mannheimia haemolytica D171]AJE09118.1 3',5'-cyclic-AMP phosphodiesterase [Mannheimia haemolytica USDA-ARS-USMARC-184]EEY09930.1 putative phosphohydrolase [Mannheimia haemolytica serotype A2 str. OVINE]MDW0534128.1 3',5'-cyclic-AMP phosphodiesterase [Mannheimia haemolytica]MDW0536732.1 3',5'-cyclic-AMP phosphodiesterase [Mannheimia haemolytica]
MDAKRMHEYIKLPVTGVIKLLQITDPHLFSNPEETLLNVKTVKSFSAVIEQINKQAKQYFDLVLATGDLIQDHNIAGYHYFAQITNSLNSPIVWLEGNHDVQPSMSEILAQYKHILPHKQILLGEQWQLLMLNTQVVGMPYGELSYSQLKWLEEKLAQYPQRFTLVALHHNILPTNSAWLDQHSLKNSNELSEIFAKFKNVKAIVHGHIHQQVDDIWHGIPIYATPSTCIQFKPNCDQFTLDLQPQGWREIELHENGTIETVVKRLNSNDFLPNVNAIGY